VSGNVLTNDVAQNPDGPGESLTVTSTGGIATTGGGAVSMASDGTYTYTPATDFTGVDTFTYTVTDGVTTDVGQVSITVTPAAPENTPPVAVDDELFTDVDTPLVLTADDLLANDTDADGDTLTIFDATLPTNGTFTDGGNGTVIYTPNPGFTGTDTFTYQLTDGQDVSDIATVTITVGDATPTDNSAPVPGFDSLATAAGTPITIHDDDLLANDFDAEGDPLTVTITQTPTNGLLVLNPDGTHTYTPAAGFTGVDTFTYAVNDGYTDSAYSAVVTINVGTPPNTPPNANTDALFTPADTPRTITQDDLLGNDFDPNADTLIAFVISQPANGTVEYNQQDGTYTYIPNTGFTGTDTFYYTAYDGKADSTPTAVTITVGEPTTTTDPVAGWDSLATTVGIPLVITPATLLANDFDADGDQLSVTITQGPSLALMLNPDGSYTYSPPDGFTGIDTFSYVATDGHGGESDEAFVTIAVGVPANAAPSAADDTLTTPVDTPLTITHADLLANDVDPNGDDMIAFVVSNPAHGTLEYNEQDNTYTYTPDAGFVGTDTFHYTAFDGEADSTPAAVTITVGEPTPPTDNSAPVPGFDSLATAAGTPLIISPATLLANDFDADGDQLSVTIAQGPSHGLTVNPDGTYTYTPPNGFTGTDTFTYVVNDGRTDSPYAATVTINVGIPPNTAPTATTDALTTPVDTPLTITQDDLLGNDFDPNADTLMAFVISQPANGTVEYNQDGTYTYTPAVGFAGTDTFYYTAFDGKADSTPTTVTITIEVANTPIQL
jgi:hypothetical protein